jgi:hypothetical protein
MDIGTELWVMAAVCSYATQLKATKTNVIPLAEDWCEHAQKHIAQLFKDVSSTTDAKDNELATRILAGDLKWMEEGIVPMAENFPDDD